VVTGAFDYGITGSRKEVGRAAVGRIRRRWKFCNNKKSMGTLSLTHGVLSSLLKIILGWIAASLRKILLIKKLFMKNG